MFRKNCTMYMTAALMNSLSLLWSGSALGQSLDVRNPAPLQSGVNEATVEDFVGPHYWYFTAERGSFSGTVKRMGSPGESIRAQISARVSYTTKQKDATLKSSVKGDVTTFSGTTKMTNRVSLVVDPGRAGLVRSACVYQVNVSGNVSFGQPSNKPEIVGTYMSMLDGYGLTKFNEDGTVICANGTKGKWTLFDAASKTYVVDLNNDHLSTKLVPARGLMDAAHVDIPFFKCEH